MILKPERIEPGPGQESVWDYPRPPRLERVEERLRVVFAGETIADTHHGYRILETSHPPTYYFPPTDVRQEFLVMAPGHSVCEFKGLANYWTLQVGRHRSERAAWNYPQPSEAYQEIKDFYSFCASRVEACWVGDERARAQPGDFYGGWIISRVVGPFKEQPGTLGW